MRIKGDNDTCKALSVCPVVSTVNAVSFISTEQVFDEWMNQSMIRRRRQGERRPEKRIICSVSLTKISVSYSEPSRAALVLGKGLS